MGCGSGLQPLPRDQLTENESMANFKPMPSIEALRDLLNYDPDTGEIRWRKTIATRAKAGNLAGSLDSLGYRIIRIRGRAFKAHRLAWFLAHGQDPCDLEVDHINGKKDDNRICNLRLANRHQNAWNSRVKKTNSVGYKGVVWIAARRRWRADIEAHGKHHHLGYFFTAGEAHSAYTAAAARLHGEFARSA